MTYFISFITSFLFGGCVLVVGVQNPIHSILILILVFILGSILLFVLQVEYFAILFMIVYVGAIVVLFLFIVMMLEIKMINVAEKLKDFFSFRNVILSFLLIEVLIYLSYNFLDIMPIIELAVENNIFSILKETNIFLDFSEILNKTDHIRAIGGILFLEYNISVMLAALLLFLSMVGSIAMTLDVDSLKKVKVQDANIQALINLNSKM